MPLVPIMPISGANRCMLPPRPREQPVSRPYSSAISCTRLEPLGQRVPVAAVRAEDCVVATQMRTDADGDRFLPDIGVARAVDQAALMRLREPLLAEADGKHRAVEREEFDFRGER